MTSIEKRVGQLQPDRYYQQFANVAWTSFRAADGTAPGSFNSTLATLTATTDLGISSSAAMIFRDLGKTVYLPGTGAQLSSVLRKVQYVPVGAAKGYYGVGGNYTGDEFMSTYIDMGFHNGTTNGFLRLN